jgi:hypothetical protein
MSTSSTFKRISILLIVAVILLLAARWAYQTTEKNRAYSFLKDAVAAQPFADQLGAPEQTKTDCYPSDMSQVRCFALDYKLDSETCRHIVASLVKDDEKECKEAGSFEQTYKDREVFYSLYPEDKFMTVYAYDE